MRILRSTVGHPLTVLVAAVIVTSVSVIFISTLEVENTVEDWFIEDDPALAAYHEFRDHFQNNEHLVIGYEEPEGVLSPEALARTARLTDELEQVDGVLKVRSVANVEEMRAEGDVIRVGKLVTPDMSASDRARVLEKLATDPMYAGSLVSPDGTAGSIIVSVKRLDRNNIERRYVLLRDVRRILASEPETTFYITGGVAFDIELFRSMSQDLRKLIPMMGVVFAVVLGLLFRSIIGVVLPTLTVAVSVICTFGVMGALGQPVTVVSAILPIVLLAIGVADSVHLISEYEEELASNKSKEQALVDALRTVFVPCLFTSVTTAAGFLALVLIRVSPLRQFALFAAVGTMLAFVATFTLVPAILRLLPVPARRLARVRPGATAGRSTGRIFAFVANYKTRLLLGSAVLCVVGAAGLPNVHTSANWYHYLSPTNPTIVGTDFVEQRIGGVYTIDVFVSPRGDQPGYEPMKAVESLAAIDALESRIEQDPAVERAISPADFVKTMNREMHAGDPAFYRIPDSRAAIGQYLLMYELDAPDGDLYDFVNFDFTRSRITARAKMSDAETHLPFIERIRRFARSLSAVRAVPTGLMVLYSDMEQYMLWGMISGFTAAFVAVSLMMILLLRTLRHGLLAMIPGVLPIVFVVGMTGWLGIGLGTLPAMMGNIALGVAVDNAIHMLTRYRRLRARGWVAQDAIGHAVTVVGRPVLYTTIVLCLGFALLGFSELQPNKLFGVLTAVILCGSLAGSLITLPATILVVDGVRGSRTRESVPVEASAEARDT